MVSYSKLILSAAVMASNVSAHNYNKCPDRDTQPKQDAMHWNDKRCPEGSGITVTDMISCASGAGGFDDFETDHDIVLAGLAKLNLTDTIDGLSNCTFFIPTDRGIVATAKSLGLHGSYDEEKTYNFLTDNFDDECLKQILLDHISCDNEYSFKDLQLMQEIKTLADEAILISEKAHPTPNCDKRVRLRDQFRMQMSLDNPGGNAKIHNKFRDTEVKNGIYHVVKSLILPKCALPPMMHHNW